MTDRIFTFLEMAEAFTASRGEAATIHRQLRYFGDINLIKPLPLPRDGRRTAQFSHREMLIARLMVAAHDHNMTRGDLAWLRSVIDHGRTVVFPDNPNYEINLDAIIPRIRDGEVWLIQLASARGTEAEARTTLSHWIRVQPDGRRNQFGDIYPDPLLPGASLGDGRPVEAVTYIHASNLLRPLIAAEA